MKGVPNTIDILMTELEDRSDTFPSDNARIELAFKMAWIALLLLYVLVKRSAKW